MPETTVSERPTFAQAFAASEAPAAASLPAETTTTETSAPVADASAAAIAPPTGTESPVETTPVDVGPIPLDRHKKILDGVYGERDTARTELKTLTDQLGWAKHFPREQVERFGAMAQQMSADPIRFLTDFAAELRAHPEHGPKLRSEAARILGTRTQPPADIEPAIPVHNEHGQVVDRAYSAGQVKELIGRAVQDALQKEVGPLKATVQTVEQERQALAVTHEATQKAASLFDQAKAWPGFTEHQAAISAAFDAHPDWSLQDCYISVAVPHLQQQSEAKTLDQLKTKAAASTVNPGHAANTTTARPKSFSDPSLKWS